MMGILEAATQRMKMDEKRYEEQIAALKAENEQLRKALSDQIDRDISGIFPTERALAERAGGVKGEWHRADGDKSILLYTIRQDGWRKGEAVMVNDVTVRIEAVPGSETPIEPIVSAILSTLTAEPATPAGRQDVGDEPFEARRPQGLDGGWTP